MKTVIIFVYMKKKVMLGIIIIVVLIGGCGRVNPLQFESNMEIAEFENEFHGKCTVISEKTEYRYREVVLYDELQGFEYKVFQKPQTYSHVIFGGGKREHVWKHCTFDEALIEHIGVLAKDSLDKLCEENQISYGLSGESHSLTLYVGEMEDWEIVKIVTDCAKILAEYNLEGRLNSLDIYVTERILCEDDRYIKHTQKGWYRIGLGEYRAEKDPHPVKEPVSLDGSY